MTPRVVATLLTASVPMLLAPAIAAGQARDTWTLPRTPWGHPNLQGIWTNVGVTPLERPIEFGERQLLTDEEVAALEVAAAGLRSFRQQTDDAHKLRCSGPSVPRRERRHAPIGWIHAHDMLKIAIAMPHEDWEALRTQRKTAHGIFGMTDCRRQEIVDPYTYFSGSITINGKTIANVGLRKKAHLESQSTLKPGIKVSLNHYVEDQRYFSMKRFALNNSKSDGSYLRTCLSYKVIAAAGLPAPRCTFARVSVNGQDMGVYVAQEEVKKPFLARHFSSDAGNLYEGTASDFRPKFFGGFEQETNELTDTTRADLTAVYDVVQGASDEQLETQLAALFDMDNLYRHWAVETLIWHRDGYSGHATNYFLYADPGSGGRFHFLAWGVDNTMRPNNRAGVPDSVLAFGAITHRLYQTESGRTRFYEELDDLLLQGWKPEELLSWIAEKESLIATELDVSVTPALVTETEALRAFVRDRRDVIAMARVDGAPAWTAGVRSLPCRIPVGSVSGSFTTTWNSLSQGAFETGSASFAIEDGRYEDLAFAKVGARIGTLSSGRDRVQLNFETDASLRFDLSITLPNERFFEGADTVGPHELTSPPFSFSIVEQDRTTSPATTVRRLEAGEGTWTFDEIEKVDGGVVSGTFSAALYQRQ